MRPRSAGKAHLGSGVEMSKFPVVRRAHYARLSGDTPESRHPFTIAVFFLFPLSLLLWLRTFYAGTPVTCALWPWRSSASDPVGLETCSLFRWLDGVEETCIDNVLNVPLELDQECYPFILGPLDAHSRSGLTSKRSRCARSIAPSLNYAAPSPPPPHTHHSCLVYPTSTINTLPPWPGTVL